MSDACVNSVAECGACHGIRLTSVVKSLDSHLMLVEQAVTVCGPELVVLRVSFGTTKDHS
jgi:hypothetical protein